MRHTRGSTPWGTCRQPVATMHPDFLPSAITGSTLCDITGPAVELREVLRSRVSPPRPPVPALLMGRHATDPRPILWADRLEFVAQIGTAHRGGLDGPDCVLGPARECWQRIPRRTCQLRPPLVARGLLRPRRRQRQAHRARLGNGDRRGTSSTRRGRMPQAWATSGSPLTWRSSWNRNPDPRVPLLLVPDERPGERRPRPRSCRPGPAYAVEACVTAVQQTARPPWQVRDWGPVS